MAPVTSRTVVLAELDNDQALSPPNASRSLVRPFAFGALGIALLVGATYVAFCFFCRSREKRSKQATPRKLVLHTRLTTTQSQSRSSCLVTSVKSFYSKAPVVSKDLVIDSHKDYEAKNDIQDRLPDGHKEAALEVVEEVVTTSTEITAAADTPSLMEDSSSVNCDSPALPGAWFDLDELLVTPLEDLQTFNSTFRHGDKKHRDEEEPDVTDILDCYYAVSPSMRSICDDNSKLIGLGISVPAIVLDCCETRDDATQVSCFSDDTAQSPIIMPVDRDIDYLAVPPPQFCARDREQTEADTQARSRSHRMSAFSADDSPRLVNKRRHSRSFIIGVLECTNKSALINVSLATRTMIHANRPGWF